MLVAKRTKAIGSQTFGRRPDNGPRQSLSLEREEAAPHLWAVVGEYADESPPQPHPEEHDETANTQRSAQRDSAHELRG